jgi:L-amino acid N-acyltransferase YncA
VTAAPPPSPRWGRSGWGPILEDMSSSPGQTFTIRPAVHEDMRAVVGIYNWAINQTFATIDAEPLSAEEAKEWWDAHARRTVTLVATDDTGIVGWARLLPWRQRGFEIVEDLVYVDPVYQRRGVGRILLAQLIEAARDSGCRTIVASVAADNRAGLRLHQSLGFEVVGTLKNAAYKFSRWMDITLVQRSLES